MIGDSLTIVRNSVSLELAKINQDNQSAEYRITDALSRIIMKVRHSEETPKGSPVKFERHNVTLEQQMFAKTAYNAGDAFTLNYSFTFRHPVGAPATDIKLALNALLAWLGTSSVQTKLINGEP